MRFGLRYGDRHEARELLDRVRLILEERRVRCDLDFCNLRLVDCEMCPMLTRGWHRRPTFVR